MGAMARGEMEAINECLGTKAIEAILQAEIDNWIRWGRKRDYMPTSFKCVLGNLHIRPRIPLGDERNDPNYVPPVALGEIGAAAFERIVVALPERWRKAFVMYHLERGVENGRVVTIRDSNHRAKLLHVQERMCRYIVTEAHTIVLREWRKRNIS
jgi:hypothetical protein